MGFPCHHEGHSSPARPDMGFQGWDDSASASGPAISRTSPDRWQERRDMDLEHFFRQIQEMNSQIARIKPGNGDGPDPEGDRWMQSAAALDTAMEELRVAEEE